MSPELEKLYFQATKPSGTSSTLINCGFSSPCLAGYQFYYVAILFQSTYPLFALCLAASTALCLALPFLRQPILPSISTYSLPVSAFSLVVSTWSFPAISACSLSKVVLPFFLLACRCFFAFCASSLLLCILSRDRMYKTKVSNWQSENKWLTISWLQPCYWV